MSINILVPLDGSPFGQQALPQAIELARRARAALHLVKVHVPPPPLPARSDFYFARAAQADSTALDAEGRYLRELAQDIQTRHDLHVETSLLRGTVVTALEQYIREQHISLVVMTSHGRGGLSRAWFGSVADALVRTVNVPVLIVRPQVTQTPSTFRVNHVLVPLDGSAAAEHAIEEARAIGSLFCARYTLLQVVTPPAVYATDGIVPGVTAQAFSEQPRTNALAYLDDRAAPLRQRGLQVDTAVVIQPQSAAGILEQAAVLQADLIVMCTHGYGGWQRYALGSVADKVLRGANVPVMMFRPAPAAVKKTPPVSEVFA